MDFGKMKMKEVPSPPLIAIYGSPGIGKTAFGIGANASNDFKVGKENHLLLNIDYRGADRLTCNRATELLGHPITGTADLNEIFQNLAEQDHSIEWLIFDDLSTLEERFVKEVCSENGVSDIASIEYGKGFALAQTKWLHLFHMIKTLQEIKPIAILLIGHTKIESLKDPMSESYSRHDLQLNKKSTEIIKKAVDLIGYAHRKSLTKTVDSGFGAKETVAIGEAQRVISFSPDTEGFESKDRFNLPKEIALDWSVFETELSKSISTKKTK
jgi:hypothetical protein